MQAQAAATNARGQGDYSDFNTAGAVAKVVPYTPTQAPRRGPLTTDNQLDVQWDFVTDPIATGGSTITSFALYIDDGQRGSFVEVVGDTFGDYTQNSKLIDSGI